jgi:hypothetical protein
MNRDDIIRMAREAGFTVVDSVDPQCWAGDNAADDESLERFFKLAYEAGAAAERTRACRIVTGLCISDNNAREINEAIRMQAADRLARHGIHLPDEDDHDGNPSF